MIETLEYPVANALWLGRGWKAANAYRRALREPRKAQAAILMALLRRNAVCVYGQRYNFQCLRSVHDYQSAAPIVFYDDIADHVEAIKRGVKNVLTAEPVLMLEKTSGSTACAKYIPYTTGLKKEFQAAIAPWMADLYGHRPRMFFGGAYWSVSPLAAEREVTAGGLTVGFEDDTEYFGSFARRCLSRILIAPPELPKISDIEASRYVTLRFLLATSRLTFISVWNPSFLTLLMQSLEQHADRLIRDIRNGTLTPPSQLRPDLRARIARRLAPLPERARLLEGILKYHGNLFPREIWPSLTAISCWASASASRFLPELKQRFPEVEIQPKGLLATEGVISIPLTGAPGAALALTSHFLEFLDDENPNSRPLIADELEFGRSYSVLITTGGGLYRYALGDCVKVVGRVEETPLVEFVGKKGQISDLCGEKLHEARVGEILGTVFREHRIEPLFAMVAPEWGRPPSYKLFLEAPGLSPAKLEEIALSVETQLLREYHYAYCRKLGQLGPVSASRAGDTAARIYLERCASLGQRHGNIKSTALHRETGWSEWFGRSDRPGVSEGASR